MSTTITWHLGTKAFTQLEEYNVATGISTGNYKDNDPMDGDYIAPLEDQISCADYFTREEADLVLQEDFSILMEINEHTLDSNKDYIFTVTSTLPVSYDGNIQKSDDAIVWEDAKSIALPIESSTVEVLADKDYIEGVYFRILCNNGLISNPVSTLL